MEPKVLILDEPTAGLDPKGHRDILDMVRHIKQERELTILLVTHNMDDVARLADDVLVMERGRLAMTGPPSDIFVQSEVLSGLGLSPPSSTMFMRALAERGCEVNTDVFTVEEAERELLRAFG